MGLLDIVGLGQDDQEVRAMKALDVVLVIGGEADRVVACLLYTSDAADE